MKIGIVGAAGRMGRALVEETLILDGCDLAGGIVRNKSEFEGMDLGSLVNLEPVGINASASIPHLVEISDAIIDFSNPKTSIETASLCADSHTVHVIGTTGFEDAEKAELQSFAKRTPIIWSANMSIGVNILQMLVEKTAALLDDDYDIEVLEMHHCRKVDAPSGTALALGQAAAKGRNVDLKDTAKKSRDGIIGARPQGEIGFATLRGGDVIGDHTVIFAGSGERIELSHKASNRRIYAKGALKAALWARDKEAGFYSMADVF